MGVNSILVTGANGFVGRALVDHLAKQQSLSLRAAMRRLVGNWPASVGPILVSDLTRDTDWRDAVNRVDAVVHCAARVHVMRDSSPDSLAEFRRINVEGTLNLARQAAEAGVQRFVFISSIGVNGLETFDSPFTADDKAAPHSPYAISKHEAELGLRQISKTTGLEVVIIRPPLVFGPNAPGNFNTLMRFLHRGIPLPLGAINNRRSLVAVDNLVDLIETCLRHPKAANEVFLVSDGEDLSTTSLLRRAAEALGVPARLIPVPPLFLRTAASLVGKPDLGRQLCGSLRVDISKAWKLMGWRPQVSVDDALSKTADYFLANLHRS